jgi:hypothetical protein
MPKVYEAKYDQVAYEILKERFFSELSRIDALDQKANNTIGFVGIILSFISALGIYLIKDLPPSTNLFAFYICLFLFGVVLLVVSIFCALIATSVKDYDEFPEKTEEFLKEVKYASKEQIIDASIEAYDYCINKNKKVINEKAEFLMKSFNFLFIAILVNISFMMIIFLTKI